MSETTAETWAVVDEAGAIHEVDVSEGRTGSPPWVAHVADGTARRSLVSARAAVVLMAQARGWSIVEVLAPGEVSAAQLRVVAQAAATLVLWHDANTPDGYLNDADGHLWTMIDALRAAGYEMPTGTPTGPSREEMARLRAELVTARSALRNYVPRCGACRSAPATKETDDGRVWRLRCDACAVGATSTDVDHADAIRAATVTP